MISAKDDLDIYKRCLAKQVFLAIFTISGEEVYCIYPWYNTYVKDWDGITSYSIEEIKQEALREGIPVRYYELI